MTPIEDLLLPRPRQLTVTEDRLWLGPQLNLAPDSTAALPPAARAIVQTACATHRCEFREHTGPRAGSTSLRLDLRPELGAEGYDLHLGDLSWTLAGGSAAGLFYGLHTLCQWLQLHAVRDPGAAIRGLSVTDRPAFGHRGVMLDVSRNRVPRLDMLLSLVDQLASWKVNQLQLYIEHTFAYAGHERVWQDWSPLDGDEIRQLDAYCAERFIELVPNQNSFGHWHRWLIHLPYRQLAECPQGIEHPFSPEPEPFGLCATDPGSLELLAELYDQLLPNFSSKLFNVGLDETLDLGRGRSAAACEERGKSRVYLEFLRQVHSLAAERGRRIMFWGDIVLEHPELIDEIPADAIALQWGYEAGHPFAENAAKLAAAGLEHYVCPGTSSWTSLASRGTNALSNLAAAALQGHGQGASGYLVTDWGDHGHLQPPAVSWLGFAAGADLGWNIQGAAKVLEAPWAERLDLLVYGDRAGILGPVQTALADLYLELGARPINGSPLFHLLTSPQDDLEHPRYRGLTAADLERVERLAGELIETLATAEPERAEGQLASVELAWVATAQRLAARIGQARFAAGPTAPLDRVAQPRGEQLAQEVAELTERFRSLWLQRSRPGGLEPSTERLRATERILRG